ncbi:MAG: thiamine monophosphate synthase [Rhodospirillaceae bacterium]|nr:MAG: thiamine monophosphate synthase [Rhodospirillaceae bacterium]
MNFPPVLFFKAATGRHTAQHVLPTWWLLTRDGVDADAVGRAARLRQGEGGVVLRAYGLTWKARLALGQELARLCRARRLVLLVAVRNQTDLRLAATLHAHGLHLPEGVAGGQILAPLLGWRFQGRRLLTVAAHGPFALTRAWRLGADAALLSPVFPTTSHPDAKPLGPVRFAAWCRKAHLPVVALGGVRAATMRRLRSSSMSGVATTSSV